MINHNIRLRVSHIFMAILLSFLTACSALFERPPVFDNANLVERDVEAPDAFSVRELGAWDGMKTLGGIWVAHPNVKIPERVVIRSTENGKFVVGALFRTEVANVSPRLRISSEAADALLMDANTPATVSVIALRRKLFAPPDLKAKPAEPAVQTEAPAQQEISTKAPQTAVQATGSLSKPFIQVGIFGVKANADNAAKSLENIDVGATIKTYERADKTFYRVLAGPAATANERRQLLEGVRSIGYKDAYAVTQ